MMKNYKKLLKEFATIKKLSILTRLYDSLPDPDKILAENNYDYEILRDLMSDPHLIATVQQRKMQVAQMGWEVTNIEDEELKLEIINIIKELDLQKIISDVLDAILYGFSILEIRWELKENKKIVPVDLIAKPQEWFIFNKEQELKLRKNVNGTYIFEEGNTLPDYKFILVQNHPTYTNPYGEKILSRCYWPITLKRATIENWQLIMERFGIPYLVGRYPVGATETDKQDLLDQVEKMSEDLITILEEGQTVEIIENPKYEIGQLYEKLAEYHNKAISKAVLTVTLTTEVQRIGSYKAAEIHKEMLGYLGITDKKLVEKALNTMIEYYGIINHGNNKMPTIKLTKKEAVIEESAQRDKILKGMGVEFKKEYYMKRYNLNEGDFELKEK